MPKAPAPVIPLPKPPAENRAAIVDEYGEAARRVAAFAPTKKRYDQLRDIITGWCPDAAQSYPFHGAAYQLTVSPRAIERTIPAKALYKALGLAKFLQAVKTTLKGASAFLGTCEVDALVVTTQSGSREIATTPILSVPREGALPKAA